MYHLPADYVENVRPEYHDERCLADGKIVHQPDVYRLADYLRRAARRDFVVDIGCGNGRKLMTLIGDVRKLGIDSGPNLAAARQHYGGAAQWIEADLSATDTGVLEDMEPAESVIICADVVEHLLDPVPLLGLCRELVERGAILLISTPDRARVRGSEHRGPPPNAAHVREWERSEFIAFLDAYGLRPALNGYTVNNSIDRVPRTILTVHDERLAKALSLPASFAARPLAVVACYNDRFHRRRRGALA